MAETKKGQSTVKKKTAPSKGTAARSKTGGGKSPVKKSSSSSRPQKKAPANRAAASKKTNSVVKAASKPPKKSSASVEPTSRKTKNVTPAKKVDSIEQQIRDIKSQNEDNLDSVQQGVSTALMVFAGFMFFFIIIPGDSVWSVIRNFIFGIFGPFAILWDALMFYISYLLSKQKNQRVIGEATKYYSSLLILIDALTYVLIKSDAYRNGTNAITVGFLSMISETYANASKIDGTGMLGFFVGEAARALGGKHGAITILFLCIVLVVMLVSHTTPATLIRDAKCFFLRIEQGLYTLADCFGVGAEYEEPEQVREMIFDETEDEDVIELDPPTSVLHDLLRKKDKQVEASQGEPSASNEPEKEEKTNEKSQSSLDELINKASNKIRKKSKAEEIQEKQDEFAKEVGDTADKSECEYRYPPIGLLIEPKRSSETNDQEELREMAEQLIATLNEYGVKASISDISRGPTVTRYEIKPAPGVKIKKITELSNDIALRLAAKSIRIEAPIPGKPAVGIEVPNQTKQMVRIREILGSKQFIEAAGALTVALGRDIEGNMVLCDLSKMPHLLIAGSTGSGKSVCVNTMLMSILYKYSPQDVRMVLIDPKSVEFDMYNGIPHLLVPVVCDPKKAAGALQWAVSEMLKRYGMLKERGARNIDNYNKLAEKTGEFEKLCRIVIVIDEMADLMIASPKEVEASIARLAAMARAAGMYMVLATQRPSVDVITGTIKNNIPSRIALMVSSQVDSRTILDATGAENLIGYGDMLYHPMGSSKATRVQGCFVDDNEVLKVIAFVKQNGSADYDESITDEIERNSIEGASDNASDFTGKDPLFMSAVEIVTEAGQASVSMLQRRLSVGYARAGKLIDQLEENGVVGPHEGSKPRAVLITHAQWLEMTMNSIPSGKDDPIVRSHSEFAAQTLDIGHEDITAHQSEFFNSELENEDDMNEFSEEVLDEALFHVDAEEYVETDSVKPRDFSDFFDDDDEVDEVISTDTLPNEAFDEEDEDTDNADDVPPWIEPSSAKEDFDDVSDDEYFSAWKK